MASYVQITLDTTAPSLTSITLNNGAQATDSQYVTLAVNVADSVTTGYKMKVWGIADTTDETTAITESGASWVDFAASSTIKLPSGDGSKTIYVKVRDAVGNTVATAANATIELDTVAPVVTVTYGPTNEVISALTPDPDDAGIVSVSMFKFQCAEAFKEYKVMVVGSTDAKHDASGNVQIGTTNGSTNMTGSYLNNNNEANFPAETDIECTIYGADLAAVSSGDGMKYIKVFVKDVKGLWSI